ncbi:uncharacterized protein LOC127103594 isoform X3 [Lathyrus oleraceus]|uniref:uncharacterized protein LOC127103594 isoform X3 n=1 Tax=Pisum sativum TaxID=3888 RepID=UPI0021CECFC4|nr:uncharacterized protein LOC127103594 isoform X3 [Pisum sativum]
MDRSWMYDRFNPHRRGLKFEFVSGVQEFIKKAKEQPCFLSEKKIKCPCETCKCVKSFTPRDVKAHLYKSGFKPNYSIWTEHGELEQNICPMNQSNSSEHMEEEEEGVEEEEDPKTPHMEASEEEDPKTPDMEESGEESDPKTPQEMDTNKQNADGKVLIRPCGLGWAPSAAPAAAIKQVIESHFPGPFHCWRETPEDVREYWWKLFGDKVAWDPHDHRYIKKTFQSRGAKRLSDMLSKVRKKGTRPHWICEEAWKGLIVHWEGEAFLKISTQNKTNRASGKGGAVHTTGRKAHVDVALSMAQELGRSVDPDELFLATHKKKSGNWVDNRSQTTYKHYQDRLKEVETQIGEASQNVTQKVDGATKLELWKEVAGGKSRGRCYGTADFAINLRHGATSLTQESREPYSGRCDHAMHLEAIDAARKEAAAARQEASTARQEAAEAKQHFLLLEEQLLKVMNRMKTLERKSAGASISVIRAHRRCPYNDDDDSLDEVLPVRRLKKQLSIRWRPRYDEDYSPDEISPDRRRKQRRSQSGRPYYDEDAALDDVIQKQHQARRRRPQYDDNNDDDDDSLEEIIPRQHQAKRGQPHHDNDDLLDRGHPHYADAGSPYEVIPKQHQVKRGHPHYDKNDLLDRGHLHYADDNLPDEVVPKKHRAPRGHPQYDDDDLLDRRHPHYDDVSPEEVLPKQRQAKSGHPNYDDVSPEEVLPKQRQAKRGHPDYDDVLPEEVLPKQRQAKRGHPHYDDVSPEDVLPKQRQAKRGHPHYDDVLPEEVLPKQRQAKRGHPHYDDDSLDEVLPKQHQAKRGHPYHDDDSQASRRSRYRH